VKSAVTTENMGSDPSLEPSRMARILQTVFLITSMGVTLFGVSVMGWSLLTVILLYWIENLIIGVWQVVKIFCAQPADGVPWKLAIFGKLFLVGFFCLHYGGFCGGHGLFILVLAPTGGGGAEAAEAGEIMKDAFEPFGPWVFLTLLWAVMRHAWTLLPQAALWSVAAMFISRGIETWRTFFASGDWRRSKSGDLMSEPYKHIVVVHIAIILCGFLVMTLGNAMPLLLGIVLGKAALDLMEIWKKRKPLS
jgi:hypothetical protein